MARIVTLAEAVSSCVEDGTTIALEGFTHLIPHAFAHEIIRQGRRDLTVIRMTPDILCDQLIGAGCVSKLVFSWGGNPGVGSLYRFREAIEKGWPAPLEIEEHSHAAMVNRYVAGASNLPFAVLRAYEGTNLPDYTSSIAWVDCPFTGKRLAAVRALNPEVAVVHAQQADRAGNVQLWGISGIQKEALLSADTAVVTVEEIVDHLDDARPHAVVVPSWAIDYVAHVPNGAHPSYALDHSDRDNEFYVEWSAIGRDREQFAQWIDTHVIKSP